MTNPSNYQVLARKYRPKLFGDVVGQQNVVMALQSALKQNAIAQAYLFSGTRGVGKTTIARIFAKALSCSNLVEAEPCLVCESCLSLDSASSLDYIEIDGASNNGVDNIRDLIEDIQYLPTNGSYRIVVIDEVHMLSTGAFNALLKTLEEPPKHAIFIFATTEPQKILGTILSRLQRFDFRTVSTTTLIEHLRGILAKDAIPFDSERSLQLLAKAGNGSVRDTLSLTDQAMSVFGRREINESAVISSLGLVSLYGVEKLVEAVIKADFLEYKSSLSEIAQYDIESKSLATQLLDAFGDLLEGSSHSDALNRLASELAPAELIWIYETLIKDFDWSLKSFDPMRAMQLSLLKVVKRYEVFGAEVVSEKKKPSETGTSTTVETKTSPRLTIKPKTFDDFIVFVHEKNKSISVNLERASFKGKLTAADLELSFVDSDQIFYDFLDSSENKQKLNQYFKEYMDNNELQVKLILIDHATKERENRLSTVEKRERSELEKKQELTRLIEENTFIQEAKQLFGADLSRIVIDNEYKE